MNKQLMQKYLLEKNVNYDGDGNPKQKNLKEFKFIDLFVGIGGGIHLDWWT